MSGPGTEEPGGAPATVRDDSPWSAAAAAFVAWRDEGRADGLDRLVRLLTPALWQIVRAYGATREEAEDVVQSTWLALVRGAGSVRDPQAVGRWLTTAARREAWRVISAGRRETPVESDVFVAQAFDPFAGVLDDQATELLWRHTASLPERCRRLLRIIAFDERPDYAGLSRELDMPVGAIGPTRGRCLSKLRRLLDDDPGWSVR